MHVQKMADCNNENMWNPRYVAYIRCFFQSLLLFHLSIVQLVTASTEKQVMLQDAHFLQIHSGFDVLDDTIFNRPDF